MLALALALPMPQQPLASSGGVTPVTGDPIAVTILGTTPTTSPTTNNIITDGWVAAITFKGVAIGQTLTPSKVVLTVTDGGYDATGAAMSVTRTVTGTAALRMPVPPHWVSGTTYVTGQQITNKPSATWAYKVKTPGGGTSTNAPTITSAGDQGPLADGYTWTWVGGAAANIVAVPVPIEATSGSDAVVYVVLDKYVSSSATFTASIGAGAYGASNASNSSILTGAALTNSSTQALFKPDVVWTTLPWQIVGNTLHVEATAAHPSGQSSRMLAAMKFVVYDNTGAATGVSATVASMVQSTTLSTTYGNPVPVFAADIDISSLTDQALYSVGLEAYPFHGGAYISKTMGFGPTSAFTTSTPMSANTSAVIPFRKDAAVTFGRIYAYVDGIGAAGAASTVSATAALTPFATIKAAATAIQTLSGTTYSRANLANHICYVNDGVSVSSFGGDLSTQTFGDVWFTIAKAPGATTATLTPDATSANRKAGGMTKLSGLTIAGTTNPVIDNASPASIGAFTSQLWLDNCIVTASSSQQPLTRMGWLNLTNSSVTLTGGNSWIGASRTAWVLMGGCTFAGAGLSSDDPFSGAINVLGTKFQAKAQFIDPIPTFWNDNGQAIDTMFSGFNTWFNCILNFNWITSRTLTGGASWVSNLVECCVTTATGGQLSAGGVVNPLPHLYNLNNTVAGDGQNTTYNDTGTVQVPKILFSKFHLANDRNIKADYWTDATNGPQPLRTGPMSSRFAVDWEHNLIFNVTFLPQNPSSLSGELTEATSSVVQLGTTGAAWTNDQSKTGGGAGNGNYVPTSGSPAKGMVAAGAQMLPFDLNGTTRKTDGTGAIGAFEWA